MDNADQQTSNDVSHDAAEVSVDKGENNLKQPSPDESPAKPENLQVVASAEGTPTEGTPSESTTPVKSGPKKLQVGSHKQTLDFITYTFTRKCVKQILQSLFHLPDSLLMLMQSMMHWDPFSQEKLCYVQYEISKYLDIYPSVSSDSDTDSLVLRSSKSDTPDGHVVSSASIKSTGSSDILTDIITGESPSGESLKCEVSCKFLSDVSNDSYYVSERCQNETNLVCMYYSLIKHQYEIVCILKFLKHTFIGYLLQEHADSSGSL